MEIRELNGLANIKAALQMSLDKGEIQQGAFDVLYLEADNFERYLLALDYVPDLKWHEVHPNPSLLPNNTELFKFLKATNYDGDVKTLYVEFLKIYRGPPLVPTGSDIS